MYATLVEANGTTDVESARGLKDFLTILDYTRILMDAVVDVARKVKEFREVEIILKNPFAHDPHSNCVA